MRPTFQPVTLSLTNLNPCVQGYKVLDPHVRVIQASSALPLPRGARAAQGAATQQSPLACRTTLWLAEPPIMQGDGVSYESIGEILAVLKEKKWSADNVAFGSGDLIDNT